MIINLLVAADENNLIGQNNKLPWHLPVDLKYFKNLTWSMPVLMGRKTFESIGKPLPGRKNIVITRNREWKSGGADVVHTIQEALTIANDCDIKELFIIGGAEIFKESLPQAHRIYLTRIHHTFEGDIYLPDIDRNQWRLVKNIRGKKDEKNFYDHSFQTWERNSAKTG